MNREEKVARLQALLDRVQLRAREARPALDVKTLLTPEPIRTPAIPEPIEPEPVPAPAAAAAPAESATPVPGPVVSDLDELEISLEPEDASLEPPASSKPHVPLAAKAPPPPRVPSQPKIELDLQDTATPISSADSHAVQMLGSTIELGEATQAKLDVEKPQPIPAARPSHEMEAAIPPAQAPGQYSPELRPEPDVMVADDAWSLPSEPPTSRLQTPLELHTPPAKQDHENATAEDAKAAPPELASAAVTGSGLTFDEPFGEESPSPIELEAKAADQAQAQPTVRPGSPDTEPIAESPEPAQAKAPAEPESLAVDLDELQSPPQAAAQPSQPESQPDDVLVDLSELDRSAAPTVPPAAEAAVDVTQPQAEPTARAEAAAEPEPAPPQVQAEEACSSTSAEAEAEGLQATEAQPAQAVAEPAAAQSAEQPEEKALAEPSAEHVAQAEPAQPPPSPTIVRLAPEPAPAVVPTPAAAAPAAPVVVEVDGAAVHAPAWQPGQVAVFVGAVASFRPVSFIEMLDASLSLGK